MQHENVLGIMYKAKYTSPSVFLLYLPSEIYLAYSNKLCSILKCNDNFGEDEKLKMVLICIKEKR
jgi:hypothetical protein